MTRFDLYQHAFGFACVVVNKGDNSIYAFVAALLAGLAAFLASNWFGFDERQGPPLELVAVVLGQLFGGSVVGWLTDYLELNAWKHGFQAIFLEGYTQVGDVDAYP